MGVTSQPNISMSVADRVVRDCQQLSDEISKGVFGGSVEANKDWRNVPPSVTKRLGSGFQLIEQLASEVSKQQTVHTLALDQSQCEILSMWQQVGDLRAALQANNQEMERIAKRSDVLQEESHKGLLNIESRVRVLEENIPKEQTFERNEIQDLRANIMRIERSVKDISERSNQKGIIKEPSAHLNTSESPSFHSFVSREEIQTLVEESIADYIQRYSEEQRSWQKAKRRQAKEEESERDLEQIEKLIQSSERRVFRSLREYMDKNANTQPQLQDEINNRFRFVEEDVASLICDVQRLTNARELRTEKRTTTGSHGSLDAESSSSIQLSSAVVTAIKEEVAFHLKPFYRQVATGNPQEGFGGINELVTPTSHRSGIATTDSAHCRWIVNAASIAQYLKKEQATGKVGGVHLPSTSTISPSFSAALLLTAPAGALPWPMRVFKQGHWLRWNADYPCTVFADRSAIYTVEVCVVLDTGEDRYTGNEHFAADSPRTNCVSPSLPTRQKSRSTMATLKQPAALVITVDGAPILGQGSPIASHTHYMAAPSRLGCGDGLSVNGRPLNHIVTKESIYLLAGAAVQVHLAPKAYLNDVIEAYLDITCKTGY